MVSLADFSPEMMATLVRPMPAERPDWRAQIMRDAEHAFEHLLERSGGRIPRFSGIHYRGYPESDELIFTIWLEPGPEYNWRTRIQRREVYLNEALRELDDLSFQRACEGLYRETADRHLRLLAEREASARRLQDAMAARMVRDIELAAGFEESVGFDVLDLRPGVVYRNVRFTSSERERSEARGVKLLREWLSPQQLQQYDTDRHFEVTGCHSGKRYRVRHGASMNIDELDRNGRKVAGWCFVPVGQLVAGDVMLAQKVALETNERAAMAVAKLIEDGQMPYGAAWEMDLIPWLEDRCQPIARHHGPVREDGRDRGPRIDPRSWMAGWGRMGRDLAASTPRDSTSQTARRRRR